jgi:hypothetical protein
MSAAQEQTRAPDLYGSIVDHLEHIADTQGAVSDYVVGLASVRAQVAIANELARIEDALRSVARAGSRP